MCCIDQLRPPGTADFVIQRHARKSTDITAQNSQIFGQISFEYSPKGWPIKSNATNPGGPPTRIHPKVIRLSRCFMPAPSIRSDEQISYGSRQGRRAELQKTLTFPYALNIPGGGGPPLRPPTARADKNQMLRFNLGPEKTTQG